MACPRLATRSIEGQYSPHLNLALFSRVMAEPQPDWPPRMRVTGFVFYNGPAALPPELDAFLDAGPPPVVFTLGSSVVAAAGRFYHESAEAAARLGVRAVLLTGGFAANAPARVPDGVLLVDRAPHQLLFPRARAVVHQGGAGTTAQALRGGLPDAGRAAQPRSARQRVPGRAPRRGADALPEALHRSARGVRAASGCSTIRAIAKRAAATAAVVRREGGAEAAAEAIASVA